MVLQPLENSSVGALHGNSVLVLNNDISSFFLKMASGVFRKINPGKCVRPILIGGLDISSDCAVKRHA